VGIEEGRREIYSRAVRETVEPFFLFYLSE
jgi:hypothetical protein